VPGRIRHCIQKPFSLTSLLDTVASVLPAEPEGLRLSA
jgi:hypothetical protein